LSATVFRFWMLEACLGDDGMVRALQAIIIRQNCIFYVYTTSCKMF
jgi:hypothetical protein